MSLLELLLAMSVTAMVSAAIAAMLGAVSSGVGTRRDTRTVMVLAHAAQSRLSAYITPSRCVLSLDGADMALWLADSRESGSVHATELRWLEFDGAAGAYNVHFVDFPAAWTQAACDLEDQEYNASTNWQTVLADYQARGYVSTQALVDNLAAVLVRTDEPLAIDSRHLTFELNFETEAGPMPIAVAATVRVHEPPEV